MKLLHFFARLLFCIAGLCGAGLCILGLLAGLFFVWFFVGSLSISTTLALAGCAFVAFLFYLRDDSGNFSGSESIQENRKSAHNSSGLDCWKSAWGVVPDQFIYDYLPPGSSERT